MRERANTFARDDRREWQTKADSTNDPNTIIFSWYDAMRARLFGCEGGISLEIGPGTGNFARQCNVSVVVDLSAPALVQLVKDGGPHGVVADAAALPFRSGVFESVYANDVLHHFKAQGILNQACAEIKRTLSLGGRLCVSDRKPSMYNRVILTLSAAGRGLHQRVSRFIGHRVNYSGSENEPPMTAHDYAVITEGMTEAVGIHWRNSAVFWLYGAFQFLRFFLSPGKSIDAAQRLVSIFDFLEKKIPKALTTDVCLILNKVPKLDASAAQDVS